MSASQAPALEAIAFQLMAALDQYEVDTTAMIEAWPDLDRYAVVSAEIEQIRMYSAALPELRVQWVELLIAHSELIHQLWRLQYGPAGAVQERVTALRDQHAGAIGALRKRCVHAMSGTARESSRRLRS